jgi:hypothetical protein
VSRMHGTMVAMSTGSEEDICHGAQIGVDDLECRKRGCCAVGSKPAGLRSADSCVLVVAEVLDQAGGAAQLGGLRRRGKSAKYLDLHHVRHCQQQRHNNTIGGSLDSAACQGM